jgi:polyisoprenoid-binding protein YceI
MKPFCAANIKKMIIGLLLTMGSSISANATDYDVDIEGMHAFIQFRIVHLGYSVMIGRFNDFGGNFSWDKNNPGASSINIDVKTKSVDTNHAERDKHVRGEDFLDVEKYPSASFKSTKYNGDASGGTLDGMLTLHGVTKAITLKVSAIGEGDDPWGGYRAGFEATTSIKRADFGMDYNLGPAAEMMDFELYIEGVRK